MDIVRLDSGTMRVFGAPLGRDHDFRLAYLPEERGLYTKQRVIDVMVYFGKLKGLSAAEARARARTWLERIGLSSVENHQVERLSKGMSQKVQIAATLLSEPELCVMEPFSGLDPVNTALVRDLIGEIRASGRTTILSTHQMSMVETLCDCVALLSEGRRVVYGPIDEVRRRYSAAELRITIEGELPEPPGVESVTCERPGTHRVVLAADTDPQRVLASLIDAGVPVLRYERVLAPMEDIFIRVVQHGEDRG